MPYLLLTLAALFWGGNYVVGHVLVQGVDPILMTEARWALTALLLGLLYRRQIAASRHLLRENAPAVLVLTLCGQVSFPLTLYIGLQTTSALNAAIYMSATPSMVLLINRLIFRDPVSARNWLGVIFSTLGVMILLFQGKPTACHLAAYLFRRRSVGHGVGAELGALLLAITSEGPPDPGEWLCRRQLAARRPDPAAHRHLLADAPPGAGLGRLARAVFPQRPGVSGDFPVVAGLSVLEQRYRRDWRHPGRNLHPYHPALRRGVEHPLPAYPAACLASVQRPVYHGGDWDLLAGETPGGGNSSARLTYAAGRLTTPGSRS